MQYFWLTDRSATSSRQDVIRSQRTICPFSVASSTSHSEGTVLLPRQVWFINRTVSLNLKFGTADPVTVEDPIYQIVVPVRAYGQFGLEVVDPGVFLQKLVGVAPAFDLATTVEYFKGILMSRLKSRISQAIVREKIGVLEIQAEMDNLSRNLEQAYAPDFAEYGLALRAFRVMSLSVRDDDPSVAMLKQAKARAAMRRIEGFTFAQERSFEVLQTGAANEGPGGAFASIGVGFGVGSAVGQMMRTSVGAADGIAPSAGPPPVPDIGTVLRAHCRYAAGTARPICHAGTDSVRAGLRDDAGLEGWLSGMGHCWTTARIRTSFRPTERTASTAVPWGFWR